MTALPRHTLTVDASELIGTGTGAGAVWEIKPRSLASNPVAGDVVALLDSSHGVLDGDGRASIQISASPRGTWYSVLVGDWAGQIVMPDSDADLAALAEEFAPVEPLPDHQGPQGPQGRWTASAWQHAATQPPTPAATTYRIDGDRITVTYPAGWASDTGAVPGDSSDPLWVIHTRIDPATGDGTHAIAWTTPTESGATGPTGPAGPPGGPVWYQSSQLADPAVSSATTPAASWSHTILDETFQRQVLAHEPFQAIYEGELRLDVATSAVYQIRLTTRHHLLGGVTLDAHRDDVRRIGGAEIATVPLVEWSSISVVPLGDYGDITITREMLAAPVRIELILTITRVGGGNLSLATATIPDGQVHWIQWAVGGTSGTPIDREAVYRALEQILQHSDTVTVDDDDTAETITLTVPDHSIGTSQLPDGAAAGSYLDGSGSWLPLTSPHVPALAGIDYVLDWTAAAVAARSGWTITAWRDTAAAETTAGFGLGRWTSGQTPSRYDELTWADSHETIPGDAAYLWALRVPSGWHADWMRMQISRGNATGHSPGGDEIWWAGGLLSGTPAHYDIYYLATAPNELVELAAQTGDVYQLQIAALRWTDPAAALAARIAALTGTVDDISAEADLVPGLADSLRDAHTVLDAITDRGTAVTGWATPPDGGHYEVGWTVISGDASTSADHRTNDHDYDVFAAAAGARTPIIWLGIGEDPATARVQHIRGGAVHATYPAAGQYWRGYSPESEDDVVAAVHYATFFLAASASDAPQAVALQTGDILRIQRGAYVDKVALPQELVASALGLPAGTTANRGRAVIRDPDADSGYTLGDRPASATGLAAEIAARTAADAKLQGEIDHITTTGLPTPEGNNLVLATDESSTPPVWEQRLVGIDMLHDQVRSGLNRPAATPSILPVRDAATQDLRLHLEGGPWIGSVWGRTAAASPGTTVRAEALRMRSVISDDTRDPGTPYSLRFSGARTITYAHGDPAGARPLLMDQATGAGFDARRPGWHWDGADQRWLANTVGGVAGEGGPIDYTVANWGSTTRRMHMEVTIHWAVAAAWHGIKLTLYAFQAEAPGTRDITNIGADGLIVGSHLFPTGYLPESGSVTFATDLEFSAAPPSSQFLWLSAGVNLQIGQQITGVDVTFSSPFLGDYETQAFHGAQGAYNTVYGQTVYNESRSSPTIDGDAYVELADLPTDSGGTAAQSAMRATADIASLLLNVYTSPSQTATSGAAGTWHLWTQIPGLTDPHVIHSAAVAANAKYNIYHRVAGVVEGQLYWWGWVADTATPVDLTPPPWWDWDPRLHTGSPTVTTLTEGLERRTTVAALTGETASSSAARYIDLADAAIPPLGSWIALIIHVLDSGTVAAPTSIPREVIDVSDIETWTPAVTHATTFDYWAAIEVTADGRVKLEPHDAIQLHAVHIRHWA